jgi:hypothetical protein
MIWSFLYVIAVVMKYIMIQYICIMIFYDIHMNTFTSMVADTRLLESSGALLQDESGLEDDKDNILLEKHGRADFQGLASSLWSRCPSLTAFISLFGPFARSASHEGP